MPLRHKVSCDAQVSSSDASVLVHAEIAAANENEQRPRACPLTSAFTKSSTLGTVLASPGASAPGHRRSRSRTGSHVCASMKPGLGLCVPRYLLVDRSWCHQQTGRSLPRSETLEPGDRNGDQAGVDVFDSPERSGALLGLLVNPAEYRLCVLEDGPVREL